MLSEKLVERLNHQVNLEYYSANLYLQMSSWCELNSLPGCAQFLRQHADEEIQHMHHLFKYINETGNMAVIGEIKAPPTEYKSVVDVFQQTYEHECYITKEINNLVRLTLEEPDYSTHNFLQWYVAEQHEEEHLFNSIVKKIELITEGSGKRLFMMDKEIKRMATEQQKLVKKRS
ncbi:MAG: non-heme ferritin [Gammaproteobacteria bacterium]|nr:MAG: non-heme ferritin [Gammaproteobacteria bacterium]RKZ76987.1 MAG: non-heme ferritin [Gammaproteobacteria bacterium]